MNIGDNDLNVVLVCFITLRTTKSKFNIFHDFVCHKNILVQNKPKIATGWIIRYLTAYAAINKCKIQASFLQGKP